jgi:hypothetical protein
MTISKVSRRVVDEEGNKALIVLHSSGEQFSFPETDAAKEQHSGAWLEVEAWVEAGNTITDLS